MRRVRFCAATQWLLAGFDHKSLKGGGALSLVRAMLREGVGEHGSPALTGQRRPFLFIVQRRTARAARARKSRFYRQKHCIGSEHSDQNR